MGRMPNRVLLVGFVAPAACLLAGCSSSGGDIISSVALPSHQSAAAAETDGFVLSPPHEAGRMPGVPNLTENQRGYLDGLLALSRSANWNQDADDWRHMLSAGRG